MKSGMRRFLQKTVLVNLTIFFFMTCASFEGLIKEGKIEEAEKISLEQKGEKQNENFNVLAAVYFTTGNLPKASEYFEKVGDKEGLKKVADEYLKSTMAFSYENAIRIYEKIGDSDGLKTALLKAAELCFVDNLNVSLNKIKKYHPEPYYYIPESEIKPIIEKCVSFYSRAGYKTDECYESIGDLFISKNNRYILIDRAKDAATLKGKAFWNMGEYSKEIYIKAGNAESYKKIGDYELSARNYSESIAWYNKAGSSNEIRKVAAILASEGKYTEAAKCYAIINDSENIGKLSLLHPEILFDLIENNENPYVPNYINMGGDVNAMAQSTVKYNYDKNSGILTTSVTTSSKTLIMAIAEKGNVEILKLLIENKANIKATSKSIVTLYDPYSRKAVLSKSFYGKTVLMYGINNYEAAKCLLDAGCMIDEKDSEGETALMQAIKNKNIDMVKLLISEKADPNIKNNSGTTCLSLANEMKLGDIAKILIDAGAK